jgi:hypothetical protein
MNKLLRASEIGSNEYTILKIRTLENRLKQLELALFLVVIMFLVVYFKG